MASSRITKAGIQKLIDQKNLEAKNKREFIKRLKITIQTENKKISELEGAVIALFELMTGEKVEE